MRTFLAPAVMWARALSASVKRPVDSMTMSTPEVLPRQLRRVADLEHLDGLTVDHDRVVGVGDGAVEVAVRGVVREEERVGRDVHDVVDGDDLEPGRALDDSLQRLPADTTETVDADANCHV